MPPPETDQLVEQWLATGATVRISSLDLRPMAHPLLPQAARCVVKGQAAAYFLEQRPHGYVWLLKKFAPGRRPTDEYLHAVTRCLPGGPRSFTCTQRRLLTRDHVSRRESCYQNDGLRTWLDGAILMPRVPGSSWASVADALREGELSLSTGERPWA